MGARHSLLTMLRLGVLALCCVVISAQNEELQAFMDQAQEDYKMLGMAIGSFTGNEWIMKAQIGVRHADDPTPIGENDKFYLSDAGRFITECWQPGWCRRVRGGSAGCLLLLMCLQIQLMFLRHLQKLHFWTFFSIAVTFLTLSRFCAERA